jgi:hypothetical protein
MMHAPPPAEYERMTDVVRRAAVNLIREETAAIQARRAQLAAAQAAAATVTAATASGVLAQARELVPAIVELHGDTPDLQAARLRALDADARAYTDYRRRTAA